MNQTTEANNGKYICLYGEDAAGNRTGKRSANPINIDTTSPVFTGTTFTGALITSGGIYTT